MRKPLDIPSNTMRMSKPANCGETMAIRKLETAITVAPSGIRPYSTFERESLPAKKLLKFNFHLFQRYRKVFFLSLCLEDTL